MTLPASLSTPPTSVTESAKLRGAGGLGAALGLSEPVRVEVPPGLGLTRIAVVIPCFNRRSDAESLLGDLAKLGLGSDGRGGPGVDLRVLLVDNASESPLSTLETPRGVDLEHLRLSTNTGGSGGYNAGMRRVLGQDAAEGDTRWAEFAPEYVWLVDSDARVAPDTLTTMLEVMARDAEIVAAGSAVADPITGQFFELGGHVNRKNGNFEPHVIGNAGVRRLVDCDYVAACCALVRADAIRCTGVFPDTFLNGDDVEWFIRMKRRTGGRIVGVPWSHAMHPRYDRFPTWTRYYMTRNAFGPLDALGVSRRTRLVRAMKEVPRGVQQAMMGRHDLARLHVLGLKHCAAGINRKMAPAGTVVVDPNTPLKALRATLREEFGDPAAGGKSRTAVLHPNLLIPESDRSLIEGQLREAGFEIRTPRGPGAMGVGFVRASAGALRRWVLGAEADVAVVPARGRPDAWYLGTRLIEVVPGGFVMKRTTWLGTPVRAAGALVNGTRHALGVARRDGEAPGLLDPAYAAARAGKVGEAESPMSVEAIVLSYNRWPALESTLRALLASRVFGGRAGRTITVVDNASSDGTPERVETHFPPPQVKLIRMKENAGVEAFNEAALRSEADAILILDDDAIPDDDGLMVAVRALEQDAKLGAVTMHPVHPRDGRSEWPFARALQGASTDAWPVMGCANLVRRSAWNAVGGYEKGFFLYRNDADLALKLLGSGLGVRFDPALMVRHDTPAGAGDRKSVRWHEMATRNWIWMARRHGRGFSRIGGALLGWAWAHKLAGLSLSRHAATLRGAWAGWMRSAPPTGASAPDGSAWRRLMELRFLGR